MGREGISGMSDLTLYPTLPRTFQRSADGIQFQEKAQQLRAYTHGCTHISRTGSKLQESHTLYRDSIQDILDVRSEMNLSILLCIPVSGRSH